MAGIAKNVGIRGRLLAVLLAIGLIPMAVIGSLGYQRAASELKDDAGSAQEEIAFSSIDKLDRNLFERYGDVQAFAQSDPARSMSPTRVSGLMNTLMGTYTPIYKLMVVADTSGRIIAANGVDLEGKPLASEKLIGRDVSGDKWFTTATRGGLGRTESLIEDLHRDELVGEVYGSGVDSLAMSFTRPILRGGKVVGVWTNRFNWGVALSVLKDQQKRARDKGAESTDVVLVDRRKRVLASNDPSEILSTRYGQNPIVDRALEPGSSGSAEGDPLEGSGSDRLFGFARERGFSTYPGLGWSAIAGQDRSEALAPAHSLRKVILIVGLLAALLIAGFAYLLAQRVGKVSSQVQEGARAITAASQQILASVNEHTASANEQSAAISETSTSVEEVRVAAEQAAVKAEQVAEQASESASAGEEGSRAVEAISDGMGDIQDRVGAIAKDILALSEQTQQIGEITRTVNDLADQSNLLAFNAAIEAAKAGDHGKGFAVVADEVRNLAEQSKEATAQVQAILGEIQKATNAAVMAAEQGTSTVEAGNERAQRAGEVIAQLAGLNRAASEAAQQIAALARQQNAGMDQIGQAMGETSRATDQFVAGARESQSAAEHLDQIARELHEMASAYKV